MASQYRLKRGPVVGLLVLIGLIGAVLVTRSSTRPVVDVFGALEVTDARVGTSYAFDGLVCVRASSLGVTVQAPAASGTTRLGLPPQGRSTAVGFPVAADAIEPLEGLQVAAGEQQCTRLLVTPDSPGEQSAQPVEVEFRYGPLGLLRSSKTVTPPVTLDVTGTGPDPRASAG